MHGDDVLGPRVKKAFHHHHNLVQQRERRRTTKTCHINKSKIQRSPIHNLLYAYWEEGGGEGKNTMDILLGKNSDLVITDFE